MGVLDDAIREHLELKRQHGASADEVTKQEQEALGAVQGQPVTAEPAADVSEVPAEPADQQLDPELPPVAEPSGDTPPRGFEEIPESPPPAQEAPLPEEDAGEEDVLEETPEFLQETPEHDRLWFEQKPPRDFDFDDE